MTERHEAQDGEEYGVCRDPSSECREPEGLLNLQSVCIEHDCGRHVPDGSIAVGEWCIESNECENDNYCANFYWTDPKDRGYR